MSTASAPSGPGVLDALAYLAEVADDLVVRTVRDTHEAVADRVGTATHRVSGGLPEAAQRGISGAVYTGIGLALRGAAAGLGALAATGTGPRLESHSAGRFVSASVNGLIGDRLQRERPELAIRMAVRHRGEDVPVTAEGLAAAFPGATGRVVVLLHGLCEDERAWSLRREKVGTTYAEALAARGWTPVLLRANTGLPLRENGAALAGLLDDLVAAWPVPVTRMALVGHSMGGLIFRAATAVAVSGDRPPWTRLVSDVITLGTPHLGAPMARHVDHGSRGLGRLPETAAFGRFLDWRSTGVLDLMTGLAEDVPPLPHATYRLVAATLSTSEKHPVGRVVGDMLVPPRSAYGRDRWGDRLFPGATTLHLGRTGHFGVLNHPRVHRALEEWLA